jgi:lipoprotein Spr
MKKWLISVMLCLPLLLPAQSKKPKSKPHPAAKPGMQQYFSAYGLFPDSANSPFLYAQVYDWIGTRYHYAGHSKKGIDCSGFVSEMYKAAYCITLAGGSASIWTTVMPVEKADLKEGDILFFKIKRGQISHVGIYLGKNKFAHASVQHGVTISDLDDEYYKKHFYKGGRIQPNY